MTGTGAVVKVARDRLRDIATPAEKIAFRRVLDEPRALALHVLGRALGIASTALAIDVISTGLPASPFTASLSFGSDDSRARLVQFAIGYAGVVPALVVTVTSLAIATVTIFGNPALLLLYRRKSSDRLEWLLRPWTGATNRFVFPLTLAVGFVLGLQFILAGFEVGFTGAKVPAILFLAFVAFALVVSSFTLVFWLVSLRRSAAVLDQAAAIAVETLDTIGRAPPPRLRARPVHGVASPFTTHYVEQETLKMCVYTLTEAAIRAIELKQRFQAREAVEALGQLRDRLVITALPADFQFLWRTTDARPKADHAGCRSLQPHVRHPLWLYELLAESFESILLISAEFHYATVGRDASKNLVDLAASLITKIRSGEGGRDSDLLLDRVLTAYEFAIDECIQFSEIVLMDLVLPDLRKVLSSLPPEARDCPITSEALTRRLYMSVWQAAILERKPFRTRGLDALEPDKMWARWVQDCAEVARKQVQSVRPA